MKTKRPAILLATFLAASLAPLQLASSGQAHLPPLSVTAPLNQSATSPDGKPVAVTYPAPTVSGGTPPYQVTSDHASRSVFPVGVTTVNITATDHAKQTARASFTVTVAQTVARGRFQAGNLKLIGSFRLPLTGEFAFPMTCPMAYCTSRRSLYVGRNGNVAGYQEGIMEVAVPSNLGDLNGNLANLTALPVASVKQPFADPLEGHAADFSPDRVPDNMILDGLVCVGGDLIGAIYQYYDTIGQQQKTHYRRALTLTAGSYRGPFQLGFGSSYLSGPLAAIPPAWQGPLGGKLLASQWGITGAAVTSWGPDAFAFDPAQFGASATPVVPLLYYNADHPTLGQWEGLAPYYGGGDSYGGGLVVPVGFSSLLVFSQHGLGTGDDVHPAAQGFCYGTGTADPALARTPTGEGDSYCYDPAHTDKGPRAYPYEYRVTLYDLRDLAAVKAGSKHPWEPMPYASFPILDSVNTMQELGGVAYDADSNRIYVAQLDADNGGGDAHQPLIHVFQVQ